MFRALYDSPLLDPLLFWIGGAALLLAVARRLPLLYAYLVAFGLSILADATLTGPWSPIAPGSRVATVASVLFVILGDLRYFVVLARARATGASIAKSGWLMAIGTSLIVPILSFAAGEAFPAAFANGRVQFLAYELAFFALVLTLRVGARRLAPGGAAYARWAARTSDFELCQYGLWALADVVVLSGYDAGFLLRVVPNVMYYVLFLPFVAWTAPRELAEPWHGARA